jgi:hypothetical protein
MANPQSVRQHAAIRLLRRLAVVDSGNSGRRFPEILAGGRWVSEVTRAERKGRCVRVDFVILGCLVGW